MTCEASSISEGERPAPEVPDAATTLMTESMRPSARRGARASDTAVG